MGQQRSEKEIAADTAEQLRRAGIQFKQEMVVGGLRVDLVFPLPGGRLAIAELKSSHKVDFKRFENQVALYKGQLKAAAAFVVIPSMSRGRPTKGVVNVRELIRQLQKLHAEAPSSGNRKPRQSNKVYARPNPDGGWQIKIGTRETGAVFATQAAAKAIGQTFAQQERTELIIHGRDGRIRDSTDFRAERMSQRAGSNARGTRRSIKKAAKRSATTLSAASKAPRQAPIKRLFAAMPFSPDYDDAFLVGMAGAAKAANAVCERVDHESFSGDVVAEIKKMIRRSAAVIVDLSDNRPNVLYEAGYAEALSIPTIQICSTPLDQLPFDVRNSRTHPYRKGQTHKLARDLARLLKNVLKP